jgi:hypothetical protein
LSILTIPRAVGVAIASLVITFCAGQVGTPAAAPESTTTTVVTTTAAPTTQPPATPAPTTTTTFPDLSGVDFKQIARDTYGKCGEWRELALLVGWPAEEWPTLSYVLYRESRCNIGSHNKTDPMSGSRGLMQINGYWCRPSQWSKAGWLQDRGILTTCDDLYNPEINLRAGLAIWLYGEEKHGCGWRGPWATPCNKYTTIQRHP